jgi:hypothetical protein
MGGQKPQINPAVNIRLKSKKHPLPHSATFDFSPHQEIIISCCINELHSLGYENEFLLHSFQTFPIKLNYFREMRQ